MTPQHNIWATLYTIFFFAWAINIFLRFWSFWGSFSYKGMNHKKYEVDEYVCLHAKESFLSSAILLIYWFPVGIYLFKVNYRNTRTLNQICLKLTIEAPERRESSRFGDFFINFEQISHIAFVFPSFNLNKEMPDGLMITLTNLKPNNA